MSLGFLTESALLPSKAKEIKVDSKSILDLKAVVFQKEQERKERKRRLREEAEGNASGRGPRRRHRGSDRDADATMGKSVYERLRAKKRNRDAQDRAGDASNRGVEERRRRDAEDRELDVDNEDDDAALQAKSRRMLEHKALLYEKMMQGQHADVPVAAAKGCLVDFGEKRRVTDAQVLVADDAFSDDMVEIVDEFGRTRSVKLGSSEHVEYTRSQRSEPEQLYFEDKRRNPQHDGGDDKQVATGGSFVVSQWEKTLNSSEKHYLEQVHAGAECAKQSAMKDKHRRKHLRLEKLKQQRHRLDVVAADADATISEDLEKEKDAGAKATAFLSQLTSLT